MGEQAGDRSGLGTAVLPVDKVASPRPEELVSIYQRRVYAVIYRMTGRHADVDDLCQEAFLQMIRSLPSFRPGTNLDAWVYRIAMNVSVDHLRRLGKGQKLEDGLRHRGSPAAATEFPEETARAVREAIDALPPEQKAVVVLRLYEGLSHEAIAEIVGAPVATVRWRFFASLEKLESVLAPYVEPGEVGRELR
jgi:RNA polymerase sigma-70 factor (ECF subfamily)